MNSVFTNQGDYIINCLDFCKTGEKLHIYTQIFVILADKP